MFEVETRPDRLALKKPDSETPRRFQKGVSLVRLVAGQRHDQPDILVGVDGLVHEHSEEPCVVGLTLVQRIPAHLHDDRFATGIAVCVLVTEALEGQITVEQLEGGLNRRGCGHPVFHLPEVGVHQARTELLLLPGAPEGAGDHLFEPTAVAWKHIAVDDVLILVAGDGLTRGRA